MEYDDIDIAKLKRILEQLTNNDRSKLEEELIQTPTKALIIDSIDDDYAYTTDEVALFLKMSKRQVCRFCRSGKLVAYQPSGPKGGYRIFGEDLKNFMFSRRTRKKLL